MLSRGAQPGVVELKIEIFLFEKTSYSGCMLSKLVQFQRITGSVLGKSQVGDFCDFSATNSHFNAIWITFRSLLESFETSKLLKLRSHLKDLNRTLHSPSHPTPLLASQVQISFKHLYFGVEFVE